MGPIGTELGLEEATSVDEVAGDAPALKHSVQLHAEEQDKQSLRRRLF